MPRRDRSDGTPGGGQDRLEQLIDRLGDFASPPESRERLWEELHRRLAGGDRLSDGDRQDLLGNLKREPVARVRTAGFVTLQLHARTRAGAPRTFVSALWEPFAPGRRAAVIAVNDKAHIKDVAPLLELGRFFPQSSHPRMAFHTVALDDPDWGPVRPESLHALCFIGRRSMFRQCVVLDALQDQRGLDLGLRYTLPPDDGTFRGGGLNPSFHVVHAPRSLSRAAHVTVERAGKRTDFAAVQRLTARVGGGRVTVLFVEGATSLGTCGAVEWLTSPKTLERVDPREISDASILEILIEVTATVHRPERPWEPQPVAKAVFVDGVNMIGAPRTMTVEVAGGGPITARAIRRLYLDDDEAGVDERQYEALVALCVASLRRKVEGTDASIVPIDELLDDASAWRSAWRPDFPGFFREQIRRRILHEGLSVSTTDRHVRLACEVALRRIGA